jgi:hypothetical protein
MSLGRVVHEVKQGEWERTLADGTLSKAYLHG